MEAYVPPTDTTVIVERGWSVVELDLSDYVYTLSIKPTYACDPRELVTLDWPEAFFRFCEAVDPEVEPLRVFRDLVRALAAGDDPYAEYPNRDRPIVGIDCGTVAISISAWQF